MERIDADAFVLEIRFVVIAWLGSAASRPPHQASELKDTAPTLTATFTHPI
jgi:hypothetical protein